MVAGIPKLILPYRSSGTYTVIVNWLMFPIVNAADPGCTISPGSMLRVRITPSIGAYTVSLEI